VPFPDRPQGLEIPQSPVGGRGTRGDGPEGDGPEGDGHG